MRTGPLSMAALGLDRKRGRRGIPSACSYVSPYGLAQIYAALNDNKQTFQWLTTAYDDRAVWMSYLAVDHALAGGRYLRLGPVGFRPRRASCVELRSISLYHAAAILPPSSLPSLRDACV
jgi:hypothetical protein